MAKKSVFGVDVGTSSVKVLAGVLDGGSVQIRGSGSVPTRGFAKGAMTDSEELATVVKEAVDCASMVSALTPDSICLGLGGMEIGSGNSIGSVAPSSQQGVSQEDLTRACRAATLATVSDEQQVLHMVPAGYWLDGTREGDPLGRSGARLDAEAHIVTIPRAVLDDWLPRLAAKGIQPTGLYANCITMTEALTPYIQPNCIVLDIGAGLTDMALYEDGKIRMTASIPLGGEYITRDLMQGLEIGRDHAEAVKRYYGKLDKMLHGREVVLDCNDYGTVDKQVSYDFLHNVIESRVEEIVAILHGYLDPVLACYNIRDIVVTGGCSALPSVPEWLEKIFALSVRTATLKGELPSEYADPANAACYGLLRQAFLVNRSAGTVQEPVRRSWFHKLRDCF